MSYTLNKVQIIGHLAQDPEMRQTSTGNLIANMAIATSEEWKTPEGEKKSRVEYHRVVVFGNFADTCSKHLRKGDKVYVEGILQTNVWENENGEKRYKTEIVSKSMIFLKLKSDNKPKDSGLSDDDI
ncbi:MAG: single-stranded DNA-binding protein [Bacteroidota bacterium]